MGILVRTNFNYHGGSEVMKIHGDNFSVTSCPLCFRG